MFLLVRRVLVCGKSAHFRSECSLCENRPLSCLHRPQRFSETDLLARCEVKSEVFRSFEKQNDGGAQVELAQVLPFAQTHTLLVVVRHVAKVIVGAFTVARVVCTELLHREDRDLVKAPRRTWKKPVLFLHSLKIKYADCTCLLTHLLTPSIYICKYSHTFILLTFLHRHRFTYVITAADYFCYYSKNTILRNWMYLMLFMPFSSNLYISFHLEQYFWRIK